MTMKKFSGVLLILCVMVSFSSSSLADAATSLDSSQAVEKRSETQLVRYLGASLKPLSKGARLYYYEPHSCGSGAFVTFPHMDLSAPENGRVGESGVRDIFRAYHDLSVETRGSNLIVVRVGASSNTLLTTPIKSIRFSNFAQYNAFMAVATIMGNEAVRAAATKSHLIQSSGILAGLMNPPIPAFPHLPSVLKHVTLDEALDRVAITFNGVVVYSLCKNNDGNRVVQVYFDPF